VLLASVSVGKCMGIQCWFRCISNASAVPPSSDHLFLNSSSLAAKASSRYSSYTIYRVYLKVCATLPTDLS